jgi:hypothetical protein
VEAGRLKTKVATDERADDWERRFTPEEVNKDLQEMVERLRESRPWLEAEPEDARRVAWRAIFPRSTFGKRQDDQLLRVIAFVKRDSPLTCAVEITRAAVEQVRVYQQTEVELKKMVREMVSGPERSEYLRLLTRYWELRYRPEIDYPKTCDAFFQAIADGLKYLETYKPTKADFGIQALQEEFIGLMHYKYGWSKKGLPTKGEVTEMAKAQLELAGMPIKSGWTKMLKEAGLGWLPQGRAGRPMKREVDANLKAKQEARSIITQLVELEHPRNWIHFVDRLKGVSGGKKLYERAEIERLEKYGQPNHSFEGDDEEVE